MTKILLLFLLISTMVVPFVVSAQLVGGDTPETIASTLTGLELVIDRIGGFLQTLLFALAGIFILIAGFQYLTAQGDPEKTKSAKNMIVYAIVAIVIALVAFGVEAIIKAILPTAVSPPPP